MKLVYILKLAITSILSKRLRTLITVGGIGICVAITLFIISISSGIQRVVKNELEKPEFSNVITVNTKGNRLPIDGPVISKFKSIDNVSQVEYIANLSGKLNYNGAIKPSPIYVLSDSYFSLSPVSFVSGSSFGKGKTELKQAILNTKMIKDIGIKDVNDAIGKKIALDISVTNDLANKQTELTKNYPGNEYQIVGIIDKDNSPLVYVTAESVSGMGVTNFNQAKVLTTNFENVSIVRESIEQLGFTTSSAKDTIKQFDRIFSVVRFILVVFGIVTLIVATLGTLNTITISLVEETRQIGFLRLLGIRKKDVSYLFIFESIILSFTGAALGILMSYVMIVLGNKWVFIVAGNSNLNIPNLLQLSYLNMIIVLFVSLILGLLIGINPARRAVRIDPLVALRF